ncbi:MAG: hypothetical protein ACYDCO_01695 [Armatimonadota bacterium]
MRNLLLGVVCLLMLVLVGCGGGNEVVDPGDWTGPAPAVMLHVDPYENVLGPGDPGPITFHLYWYSVYADEVIGSNFETGGQVAGALDVTLDITSPELLGKYRKRYWIQVQGPGGQSYDQLDIVWIWSEPLQGWQFSVRHLGEE